MIPFNSLYRRLAERYGSQHWWPADSQFEIMLGAILVQRTTWGNVESAILQLRQHDLLSPETLAHASPEVLEGCVRMAGFYRAKARRIRSLAIYVNESGGVSKLARLDTDTLRQALLAQEGVGQETADAILLYAFERPAVVVDAYLRRLAARLNGSSTPPPDQLLRQDIARQIATISDLNEFHALVVAHGKDVCGATPQCGRCVVRYECGAMA